MGFLYGLVVITMLFGLIYSFRIRGRQKTEIDQGVSDRIKDNRIGLNPIFWAYIITVSLAMLLIWIYKSYYGSPF
jgi:hypothetical protein